jgi:triphosphoribosyl-dephospho-CoA synthase
MTDSPQAAQASAFAKTCFLRACVLDVAVRKPGNVSAASPGHGMAAAQFPASAQAAAAPLFVPGERVGARVERAMAATWAAIGCNTNLGILLLCAPIAAAVELPGALRSTARLRAAVQATLAGLDLNDTRRTYRAIALANPAGLGRAQAEDVHDEPHLQLRAAMALAAQRDSIARQYANGFDDVFDVASPLMHPGFSLVDVDPDAPVDPTTAASVQRVFLSFLSRWPDSHIVRKHGGAVAHTVMSAAQAWQGHLRPDADPAFAAWDEALKAQRINPGTSADLSVAALLVAGLLARSGQVWHGK